MNGTTTQPASLFDRLSSDGTLLQRGDLELSLEQQFCEGAATPDAQGHPCLTLTLFVCDPINNSYREATVFKTLVRTDTPAELRKKLLLRFMDRLVTTYGANPFSAEGELQTETLEGFRAEVESATASWAE